MQNRIVFVLLTLVSMAPFGNAAALEKGREYVALPSPQPVETGEKIEVREFFWYGCGHCYSLEPTLVNWLKRKPANVQFVRTPAAAPNWLVHARAFYAFAALGVTDKTHSALFRAIHEQNRPLDNEEDLAKFAREQAVDPAKFKDAFNSFGVRTNVEKAKRLSEAYLVTSVPMLAVDGKYLTNVGMAGGQENLTKVLDQLVQQAARERASAPKRPIK